LGPFGTVAGVQLVGMFQSLLAGLSIQVALPAWRKCIPKKATSSVAKSDAICFSHKSLIRRKPPAFDLLHTFYRENTTISKLKSNFAVSDALAALDEHKLCPSGGLSS
jgi:hypothetical protein